MEKSLILLGLGALLVGCGTGDTGETSAGDDTEGDTAPLETEIDEVSYGGDEDEWVYEVMLIGYGGSVELDIYQQTGGKETRWEEAHVLDNLEYDPDGQWDKWGITLPIVTDWKDQVDSVNTLFSADLEPTMTWMVTAYDLDGYFADCAVWGQNIAYYASFSCWELEF